MRSKVHIFCPFLFILLSAGTSFLPAQSQASNGRIEGTVLDANGQLIPGVLVAVKNIETGFATSATASADGTYRLPILPIGTYRITFEAAGFRRLVREGIALSAGQTVVIDPQLTTGDINETVTVSADAPVADRGRIENGRVMNSREVRNLPLVQRNPWSYAFLQPNVTGSRLAVPGFGFPNVNANGYSRRANYQLDGNYATDMSRGGVREILISETFVREVRLMTSGMAPEFGSTTGLVMNVITPSGTNELAGTLGYSLRRRGMAAQRFNVAPGTYKRDPVADDVLMTLGGPILKDRWHFYVGFEHIRWDLAGANRTITISEENKRALIAAGLPADIFPSSYSAPEQFTFLLLRSDVQLDRFNRLGFRYHIRPGELGYLGAAQLRTLQRTQNLNTPQWSLAFQLVSADNELVNELRFQYSGTTNRNEPNEFTGSWPSIDIRNVASFGAPGMVTQHPANVGHTAIQNNLSGNAANHSIKAGAGVAVLNEHSFTGETRLYTFASLPAYLLAVSGSNPRSYATYTETIGDPENRVNATFLNAFVQDDWNIGRRLKLNYGIRYDLYIVPNADPNAPLPDSRHFRVDRNNFGPRIGLVYGLSDGPRPSVIRASAGLYYDPPSINYYTRAIRNNGNSRFLTFTVRPNCGPAFPNSLGTIPAGCALPEPNIDVISPGFKTMSAFTVNLQYEKSLTEDLSITGGFVYSAGRHIPVFRSINCLPAGETLADGRPVYGTAAVNQVTGAVTISPCTNRIDPQFNIVTMADSVGNLTYRAATLQISKRFSHGLQFSAAYTLSRSVDDAPERNIDLAALSVSDPSNRKLDRSRSSTDQTHVFVMTFVGRPKFRVGNRTLRYILNNNQLGFIGRASDGERYNIAAATDLNRDGFPAAGMPRSDRPVGIGRYSGQTPSQFNVDVRFSRFHSFSERLKLELYADIVNIFNTNSVVGYNNTELTSDNIYTSQVDPLTGVLHVPLPDFRQLGVTSLDSRRMLLGLKFHF